MRITLPRLSLLGFRFSFFAGLVLASAFPSRASDAPPPVPGSHLAFRATAAAAVEKKDYAAAREALTAALKLRPDSPRYLHNLAAVSALAGDKAAALGYLDRLAALGVATAVERDPSFASLQGTPEFSRALQRLVENRAPKGEAEVLTELPGRAGIIEGIAFRPRTGDIFLGDVHNRCIWRRDSDGRVARFTAGDSEILGVFGLALDERRNTLWAATSALPEMMDFSSDLRGHAALAEFNLGTSELRRVVPVPGDGRSHALGDLVVAPDGTVYATDSLAPIIWQLPPGAEEMVKLVESPDFVSLQGLVLTERSLVVADYANGLFVVDLPSPDQAADPTVRPLAPPPNTTLLGLDGLVPIPGGLVAVQNGVSPQRVIRITLDPALKEVAGVTVLASGLPDLTDLCLITLINDRPTFIANAGWDGFNPEKMKQPPAHTVRLMQVALP